MRIQEVCPTSLHVLCGLGDDILVLACPVVLDILSWTDFLNAVKGQRGSSVAYKLGKNSVRDQTGAVAVRCYTTGMVSRHKCACQNSFHGKNQPAN